MPQMDKNASSVFEFRWFTYKPGLVVTNLTAPEPQPLIFRSFLKCKAKYN